MVLDMGNLDLLLVKPSFLTGVGRAIDVSGTTFYRFSRTPDEADERALHSDWEALRRDMEETMKSFRRQYGALTR